MPSRSDTIRIHTRMVEAFSSLSLQRLLTWLSPAFPVGAFAYSHGLERAVEDAQVCDDAELGEWISHLLRSGSAWNDGVLLAEAWRRAASGQDLSEVAELAEALAGSRERHLEAMLQGAAFLSAAKAWPSAPDAPVPDKAAYCVAVGAITGVHAVGLMGCLVAYLHAFTLNQVQAAIRLGLLGQVGGVGILVGLEELIGATAARAAASTLDDLGSSSFLCEVAAMRHETQYSRVFRS